MELLELAERIRSIRQEISQVLGFVSLNEFEKNVFAFVDDRLREMEAECRDTNLKPKSKRWPELARIAEETHPSILSPELGGRLIEIEKKYQEF